MSNSKLNLLFYIKIILLINTRYSLCFNVNFHYNYDLKVDETFNTEIREREIQKLSEKKGFYNFNGFEGALSVPLVYPADICIFNTETGKYASALHAGPKGIRHFVVYKIHNDSFEQLLSIPKPNATSLDCLAFRNKGYVALVQNITESISPVAESSSCIYEIAGDIVKPIQNLTTPNMQNIYLWTSGENFFMLQTFSNKNESVQTNCTYFIMTGETFSDMGRIPCYNVQNIAKFDINGEFFLAVANSKVNFDIFKTAQDDKQLILFQSIKVNGLNKNIQHFEIKTGKQETQHYLITLSEMKNNNQTGRGNETLLMECIFYLYNNKKFEVSKKIVLKDIKKIIPLKHKDSAKHILLAITLHHTVKVFTFERGQLFETPFHYYTEAFGNGLSNIRTSEENGESLLIIANQQMRGNKTNVFKPLFKEDIRSNSLRYQMLNWVESETKRLEKINVDELNEKIEKKLQLLDELSYKRDLENSHINAVKTENLIYPKLKMSTNYWKALFYINQAVELLEQQLKEKQEREQQERSKRNTGENLVYLQDFLDIDTLIVKDELKAKYINKINIEKPEFKEIQARKVTIKKELIEKPLNRERYMNMNQNEQKVMEIIEVPHLKIQGKLNEYTWEDLLNNTLKRNKEIQFIKSPVKINNLKGQRLVLNNNEINGEHLSALIPIDGGEYVINQDIQFAAPIKAKNVYIHERLNNVHVFNGKFDVLLKKANETQIIEGIKQLNNVKVMEPITIAGQLLGKHLESITPNKAVHDPLILQGDFVINGDVSINQILKAADIIDLRAKMSVKQTLENGIGMDKPVTDVKLKFLHDLKANNSHVSFVNKNDLQRLIKLNHEDIQIVEGEKIFENSLEIRRGFSEVKNLNGIDMERLEKNSFLKHTNQTIKVPMKFSKIQTKSVTSNSIQLSNRNITDYLTKNGNQTVHANLKINNLKTNSLHIEKLNTNHRIFQQNLHDIYQQKSRNAPQQDVFQKQRKFHGSIYVQNLIVNSTINNRNVLDIENNLLKLNGNIKYVGNFKFNYPLNIKHLRFYGNLNDIKAKDFGKCWLQKNGQKQQDFRGIQTIAKVNAKNGLHCKGKINDYALEDLYTKTYWINRDEHIKDIVFENPIEMSSGLNTSTLNSNLLPHDMLRLSKSEQFLHPLIIEGDLEVIGHISNISIMNHINLHALDDFLNGGHTDTLYVENAYFTQGPPLYKTLNGYSIAHILDSVWLANENVVLPKNIKIQNANFDGLLLFEGPINDMDLEFVKNNYLSKSKNQDISVDMVFDAGIICDDKVDASDVELFGPLIDEKSSKSFNFLEFVENTLKTSGPHVITGNWSILEAVVDDNLNEVTVNDLNLVTDIVHTIKTTQPYNIESTKIFKNATIENLLAHSLARLNQVPITNWLNDAVYVYENYTIKGKTIVESLNVFNDLSVLGKLNNFIFNENSLLLQDTNQTLPGNLRITSHLMNEKRFLTNNIENMYADFINSEYMPNFMENILSLTKNLKIQGHVLFKEPLKVNNFQGNQGTHWLKRKSLPKQNQNDYVDLNKTLVDDNISLN